MNSLSITKRIEIKWVINNHSNYGFGDDKLLYNLKTGRVIKQTINNYSKGYWIGKKFYTLKKLKPSLIRPINFSLPF